MRFWKTDTAAQDGTDAASASTSGAYSTPVPPTELKWELSTQGLTTQYKSFYFTFEDGSAGYFQFAYGNLGILVKVAPMGWTLYTPGTDAIVGSQTLHASSMHISRDQYSVTIGSHSLSMREDCSGWTACIKDPAVTYNLEFDIESECFAGYNLGASSSKRHLRHRIVPVVKVRGTVEAHGKLVEVNGQGTYIEAFFTHVKFTDLCNSFANFQLRSPDSSKVLTMLHYIPRGLDESHQISQGSYTENGKVVAIAQDNKLAHADLVKHAPSGYMIPTSSTLSWRGSTLEGKSFDAQVQLPLGEPSSVTDVLSIFPSFFKDIVKIWAGLPFVFCWRVPDTRASIHIDGVAHNFEGLSNTELTHVHLN
ncbi:Svf1 family protein Svf2 [Protomyces lactucae-debilis]|uniref:Svf1 family protein Svf2 n=1 Tax=Protomyces lactucae-debilis TaxID=2754530 RepID=A0A1Y2FH61_PROLT|nr:Svf1 family protein Svf2 [Protomyces lactucae-debilis]ORY82145.1 Svf1 family protein Svf2 [Protomyces lactucae-debilis]